MHRFPAVLIVVVLALVSIHEFSMAATGHAAASPEAASTGQHHGHSHDPVVDVDGSDPDSLPLPCEWMRAAAPSLQRPATAPANDAAFTGTIPAPVDLARAGSAPPDPLPPPVVRCRAVFQVYRI